MTDDTDAPEQTSAAEQPHVLGLADMRVDEMRAPFDALGDRATLVTVDPDEGIRAYLSAARRGARVIARRDSDAILVYNGSGLIGTVGATLSRYSGVPMLVRLNGDIFRQHRETAREQFRNREWRSLAAHLPFALLTRALFRSADGFVPVSSTLRGIVRRQTGCPEERIESVPNPVSISEFAPEVEDEDGDDPVGDAGRDGTKRLLTVTNLSFRGKYEGVTELVDAVLPVLRRREDLEYVVAGDGRYRGALTRYLDERAPEVRDRIRVPGFVDDVAGLYRSADVFLYASYIDGYPNVILEAQAAGLPIVTNPAYGIVEQVEDGESGLLVDTSDTAAVARTVASLLDDPTERERLGRNARRRVETENRSDCIASELYETVLSVAARADATADHRPVAVRRRPQDGIVVGLWGEGDE